MSTVKYPAALVATFVWIGFVSAISFMEAWLKFRAPGITLPLGLGIGRLVFNALNKVEWVFAVAIVTNLCMGKSKLVTRKNIFLLIPLLLLVIQTIHTLPVLDARAEMHIQGLAVAPSNLHFYYVGMEFIKAICLTVFGITLFKASSHEQRRAYQ